MSQERIDDSMDTPWWGEHDHRYEEALKYTGTGQHILDIACGTGFGTFKLFKEGANTVIGGDISDEALEYCRNKYASHLGKQGLEFRRLDATALDFEDKVFDVIVSFETIEHITEYRKVVEEFSRVLKNDGVLILSTTHIIVSSPDGIIRNPFHVKEFTYRELRELLEERFSECKMGGQKYIRYDQKKAGLARVIEWFFYLRGIRRIPLKIRDAVMRGLGQKRLYPLNDDYEITYDMDGIRKCITLFAVCRK